MRGRLFVFGYGYTARALDRYLRPEGWEIVGTSRNPDSDEAHLRRWPGTDVGRDLEGATHLLTTVPPDGGTDPVLAAMKDTIVAARPYSWVGYLSTTGVYGDRGGGWVDERTPPRPVSERGHARLRAEQDWQALAAEHDLPLHIFRLPGIYGPRRSALDRVRAGTRRVIKPGQVFSRIHVDDIACILAASMRAPRPGIYNMSDDLPSPPQEVLAFAADLTGMPPPPEVAFEEADLSPMARSFYAESKRIRNDLVKRTFGVNLRYPDYRAGLRAIVAEGG